MMTMMHVWEICSMFDIGQRKLDTSTSPKRKRVKCRSLRRSLALRACIMGLILLLPACDQSTGFQVVPLANQFNASGPQRYVVFVPESQPEQSLLPVLLFLNGVGENGNDGLFQLSNNFGQDIWRRRNQLPMLIVSPQCAEDGRWTAESPDTKYALHCVDDAIERFGGDPERVYISGVSSGGSGSIELASAYPERFAAAMPVSCGTSGDTARLAAARMPLRCLANRFDKPKLLNGLRQAREQWFSEGLSPVVTEINGLKTASHNAWDEAYNAPISFWWLLQQGRSETTPRMQMLKPSEVLASWKTGSQEGWRAERAEENSGELVGSDQEQAWLISPAQVGDAQLHLDAFLDGTQQIHIAAMSGETPQSGSIEFVVELPEAGTGGVRDWDGRWGDALDPPAQQSLLDGWNDLRLVRQGDVIELQINGWPAASISEPRIGPSLHWGLRSSEKFANRFRFLRTGFW